MDRSRAVNLTWMPSLNPLQYVDRNRPNALVRPRFCTGASFVESSVMTSHDARNILLGARIGAVPVLKRPLKVDQQCLIRSGDVFIWEAKGPYATEHGLERFRDGHQWSPSRRRGDFLYYEELEAPMGKAHARRIVRSTSTLLVKKVYGGRISCSQGERKFHLASYYIPTELSKLVPISLPDYSDLGAKGAIRSLLARTGPPRLTKTPQDICYDGPVIEVPDGVSAQTANSFCGVTTLGGVDNISLSSLSDTSVSSSRDAEDTPSARTPVDARMDIVGQDSDSIQAEKETLFVPDNASDGVDDISHLVMAGSYDQTAAGADYLLSVYSTGCVDPMWLSLPVAKFV
ncbi:hypothetical protein B0H11DRAFT_2237551 [Mycena galericulata]|nr:hypothetical protein B0H11DRAFT_2237551 [Mycena galericulata]